MSDKAVTSPSKNAPPPAATTNPAASATAPVANAKGGNSNPSGAQGIGNAGGIEGNKDAKPQESQRKASDFKRHPLDDMAEFEQSLRGKSDEEKEKARKARRLDAKPEEGQSGMDVGRPRYQFIGGSEAPEGISIGTDVWAYDAGPGQTVYVRPVGADDDVGAVLVPLASIVKVKEQG